jgi:hypothetical protein
MHTLNLEFYHLYNDNSFFSFQPSHTPLGAYLMHVTHGTVEDKLLLDERLKTYSMCAYVHQDVMCPRYAPLRENG